MIATSVLCWILMKNFEFEVGDMIEKQLLRVGEFLQEILCNIAR